MDEPAEIEKTAPRGRPKTRFADKKEQVRQNMQLYRARRTAELEALGRTLESMLVALEQGDTEKSFLTAAAVAGIWKESILRVNLIGVRAQQRKSGAGKIKNIAEETIKAPDASPPR